MFGTDGIRGNADQFPFTSSALFTFGRALATWSKNSLEAHPFFLIGYDTRESCSRIKQCIIEGLLHEGVHYEDAGILPTPAILKNVELHENYTHGIMISASHNPYHDNGIKIFKK